MKFLLVAVNASFSHTCLAVHSISEYVNVNSKEKCDFVEFTINQPVGEILRGINKESPDVIMFSSYIWNAEVLRKIIPDVKKILPYALLGAGGPEFGFAAEYYLNLLPSLDFVMKGEGERTVLQLMKALEGTDLAETTAVQTVQTGTDLVVQTACQTGTDLSGSLSFVKGLYLRHNGKIIFTGPQELIPDLGELPFPYKNFEPDKIFYYESSRGCPYNCSYCMSSVERSVRFMPLERVFSDLQRFLNAKVPLVKFVDRTYNLKEERYIAVWNYILEHHNGITMFHFEIEAEYLSPAALDFLQKVPSGVMQFEIGVQSSNPETLKAVNRSPEVEKLAENIRRIPKTIHQHLDLIAGLPYENLESFGKSFDFVMALKPDALQLGFLKVLHGTQMEKYGRENGWKWMENPVYETFSTPYMSYEDMLFLKDIEVLTDAFWNSGKFVHTMNYAGSVMSFWEFFCILCKWGQSKNTFSSPRRETYWFEFLAEAKDKVHFPEALNLQVLYELLRYDFILRGKQGNFPSWYKRNYSREGHLRLLEQAEQFEQTVQPEKTVQTKKIGFAKSDYEQFSVDVEKIGKSAENGVSGLLQNGSFTRGLADSMKSGSSDSGLNDFMDASSDAFSVDSSGRKFFEKLFIYK